MLRTKASLIRNKKGNIVRLVREHYLRDDIWCMSQACQTCGHETPLLTPTQTSTFAMPHYILPDATAFLTQIDVFEHELLRNVIVLQTVLEQVRHGNQSVYARLRKQIANPAKHFIVFSNEHHRETYFEKEREEKAIDRDLRVIRAAVKWYNKHIPNIKTILVAENKDNFERALGEGLVVSTARGYVEGIPSAQDLLDMLAYNEIEALNAAEKKDFKYEEHLSKAQINLGIKSGVLLQGTINISTHNYLEGTVYAKVNGVECSVLILGRESLNRAMGGDTVAIKLLPKSAWRGATSTVVLDETDETKLNEEKEAAMEVDDDPSLQPTAKVVGIIKRSWRLYCGFLDKKTVKTGSAVSWQNALFISMDRRIPRIRIRTRQAGFLLGQRIIVAIDSWAANSKFPVGHFVRALGSVGDKSTETEVLLIEHDVAYQSFSESVLSCLPLEGEAWIVTPEHLNGRQDFRHLNVCSIDPPGCTDIDDALHARLLPNGNYEVGVHIADVTHFVKPGTAMDKEAASRGTTVYLVDKRIDMLPALLGTNLCSLRSNVDRLAFSCVWEMTGNGDILTVNFTKSIIRSKASLTYEEAQNLLDDPTKQDEITLGIRVLNQLAKKLRAARITKGALTLASPEVRFRLENDSQDPVDVEMKELKETNALVEEFMLLANISVAKKIYAAFSNSAVLRRHPTPPLSNFERLARSTAEMGFTLHYNTSLELAQSLDKAVIPEVPYFNKLVRILTTRCMMQALYFSAGTATEEEFRHYGLASEIYTHFTSPIRRYAGNIFVGIKMEGWLDILVHRQLQVALEPTMDYHLDLTDSNKIKEVCDNLNYRNRMAQQASRSSVELYTHLYFQNREAMEEGFVTRVMKNGFSVLIPRYPFGRMVVMWDRYGVESLVQIDRTNSRFNDKKDVLEDGQGTCLIKIFQKVTVLMSIVSDSDNESMEGMRSRLRLQLIEPKLQAVVEGGEVGKRTLGQITEQEEALITKRVKAKMMEVHTAGE